MDTKIISTLMIEVSVNRNVWYFWRNKIPLCKHECEFIRKYPCKNYLPVLKLAFFGDCHYKNIPYRYSQRGGMNIKKCLVTP